MKTVHVVAGARPNFVKIAPIVAEMRRTKKLKPVIVHTGQHYDFRMSQSFFNDLRIPKPDVHLNVGSGTHAVQTAAVLEGFEKVLAKRRPDLVLVVGDVNSTLACAVAASKMGIRVAHVEAGLRSFDRSMPEEVNRVVVDHLSDILFVTEPSGLRNLEREGIDRKKVHYAGNVMIDSLAANQKNVATSAVLRRLGLARASYAVMTLHRPSNVDDKASFLRVLRMLERIPTGTAIVYPAHPRSLKMLRKHGLEKRMRSLAGMRLIEPLGYTDFTRLLRDSRFVLTDSGGIQEETTIMGVPCLTMRENTERPVTITQGTNELVGTDTERILRSIRAVLAGRWKKGIVPRYWDGKAARRIVKVLNVWV